MTSYARCQCTATTTASSAAPVSATATDGTKSSAAAIAASARSTGDAARRIHPAADTAIARTPNDAVNNDQATAPAGACSSSPRPRGSIVNANGTMNAGAVYFHDSIVVRSGLPPVSAAAANGESAVGGLTSDNT